MEQNETINEQQQEKQPMSPFCEALMDATDKIYNLEQPGDCAIAVCSDGKMVAIRKCGRPIDTMQMFYQLMKSDKDFMELVMESFAAYARHHLDESLHARYKKDEPTDQTATIKSLN